MEETTTTNGMTTDAPGEEQASRAIQRQRRRLKKDEVYHPNYTGLATIVPDGILTKVQAIVGTQQKGSKSALRLLRSLEFHQGMQEEHHKVVQYHKDLNERLLDKLAVAVGDMPSASTTAQVIEFLQGLPDAVLDSIAVSKGVSVDLTRDEMIAALTTSHTTLAAATSPVE